MFVSVSLHFNVCPLILLCVFGKLSAAYELLGLFSCHWPKARWDRWFQHNSALNRKKQVLLRVVFGCKLVS